MPSTSLAELGSASLAAAAHGRLSLKYRHRTGTLELRLAAGGRALKFATTNKDDLRAVEGVQAAFLAAAAAPAPAGAPAAGSASASASAGASAGAAAAAAADGARARGGRAAAGGAGGAAAAAEAEYVAVMSPQARPRCGRPAGGRSRSLGRPSHPSAPLPHPHPHPLRQTYDSAPLLGTHYFRRELPGSLGGEAGKQRTRRVVREAAAMRSALPCAFHSTVAVRVDESRPDVLQALVVPHRDTPYANGVFVFDILLPGDYPQSPPRVQLLTTGGGRVRFKCVVRV